MYVEGNPATKKALKEMVARGKAYIFSPGPFPAPQNGRATVEGPHYPKPHKWYAEVVVVDGIITQIK